MKRTLQHLLSPLYRRLKRVNPPTEYPLPREYIEKDRTFFYWKSLRFVDAIRMESTPWTYETVLRLTEKAAKWTEGDILDYGCWQHKSFYLRKLYGERVHSADIENFAISNFTKIDPQWKSLPFNDSSFWIVICSEVIEHVFSPFALLEELLRVTRDKLIISTPNPCSLKSRWKFYRTGFLDWFTPTDWEYHITPVFYWQIEKFLDLKGYRYTRTSNHKFFWLPGSDTEYWESLIYEISKR